MTRIACKINPPEISTFTNLLNFPDSNFFLIFLCHSQYLLGKFTNTLLVVIFFKFSNSLSD